MKLLNNCHLFSLGIFLCVSKVDAFSSSSNKLQITKSVSLSAYSSEKTKNVAKYPAVACAVATTIFANIFFTNGAFADEYGREVEAPTLLTGETVEICVKRGPLGACQKTELRTADNDNDKSNKYFKDPAERLKEKYSAAQLQSIDNTIDTSSEGNELIEKLRQASLDNKEKNDRIVRAKTLQNDLGASFGPLDNQVVILNTDGESFTLLKAPQAMRLKKAGYIKDKRFVTQPTQEVIDEALEAPEGGIGSFFKGLMGDSD